MFSDTYVAQPLRIHDYQPQKILYRHDTGLIQALVKSPILPNLVQAPNLITQGRRIVLLVHCTEFHDKQRRMNTNFQIFIANRFYKCQKYKNRNEKKSTKQKIRVVQKQTLPTVEATQQTQLRAMKQSTEAYRAIKRIDIQCNSFQLQMTKTSSQVTHILRGDLSL